MKILVLSPILRRERTGEEETSLSRELNKKYQKFLGSDVEIERKGLDIGAANIETFFDEYIAGPDLMKKGMEAEKEGFDAIVLGCAGDPLIEGLREALEIPVVGPMEASLHLACILGHRFTWLTPAKYMVPRKLKAIEAAGLRDRLASIRDLGLSVAELHEDPDITIGRIIKESKEAIERDGAEVIILGCLGMTEFAEEVSKKMDVPVIEPLSVGLKLAESLVRLGLRHSRITYPKPREKKRRF